MGKFDQSYGTAYPVDLTTIAGVALTPHTGASNYYDIACHDVSVVDFYLDPTGTKFMEVKNLGAFASKEVPLQMDYFWKVGTTEVKKGSYTAITPEASSEDTLPTAYAPGEFVPPGTVHFIRVTAGGVSSGDFIITAYAMASQY